MTSIAEQSFSECAELKALQRAAPVTCAPMGAQAFLGSGPTARPLLASRLRRSDGVRRVRLVPRADTGDLCGRQPAGCHPAGRARLLRPTGGRLATRLGGDRVPGCVPACTSLLASRPSAPAAGCRLQCVEGSAFNGCRALAAFDLPAALPAMRDYVFCGCTARTQETFGWAATDMNVDAFQRSGVGASGPAISPQMAFVGPPPSRQAVPCDSVCELVSQAARGWSQVRARM